MGQQNVKKMSNVKKSNILTMEEVHKKIDVMRFAHIDVNFDITYDGNQKPAKCALKYFRLNLVTFIFDVKLDINICKPH